MSIAFDVWAQPDTAGKLAMLARAPAGLGDAISLGWLTGPLVGACIGLKPAGNVCNSCSIQRSIHAGMRFESVHDALPRLARKHSRGMRRDRKRIPAFTVRQGVLLLAPARVHDC